MKKVLWIGCGCAVLLVLGSVGAGLVVYLKVLKPVIETASVLQKGYQETNTRYPFTQPSSNLMDEARFQEFLATRKAVAQEAVKATADMELMGRKMNDQKKASLSGTANLVSTGVGSVNRIAQIHIAELGSRQMSAKEYQWYSQAMIGTANEAIFMGRAEVKPIAAFFAGSAFAPEKSQTTDALKRRQSGDNLVSVRFPFHEENLKIILANEEGITTPPAALIIDNIAISFMGPNSGPRPQLELEKK